MDLQLSQLHELHPLLAQTTAFEYAHRAAVGLRRHSHSPGVSLGIALDDQWRRGTLHWQEASLNSGEQLDFHRVTEDAAEAIALALVHVAKGWVVRRRLQRGEFADWLLVDSDGHRIAMEVSGVDTVDAARLQEKVEQVRKSKVSGGKVACVVELGPPRSRLRTV
jgi:hypothetical protein